MTPKLVFPDDRMAVKQVFLGPGNCFLRELAVRLGRQRPAAAQIPQRHVFVRSQLALHSACSRDKLTSLILRARSLWAICSRIAAMLPLAFSGWRSSSSRVF